MSQKFLTDVIADSDEMPASQAGRVAADVVAAIKRRIIETGRFSLPEFGSFTVRETKARTGLNPRTGDRGQADHQARGARCAAPMRSPRAACARRAAASGGAPGRCGGYWSG